MRIPLWTCAFALLLIPLIAMQFTSEVEWTLSDFVFAAVMIGGAGVAYEISLRLSASWAYRAGAAVAVLAAFLLIWINAAVGIIGDEGNVWNLMFASVLLVAFVLALFGRLTPRGMARAMFAAACVQVLVGAVAIIGGLGLPDSGPLEMAGLTGIFTAFWLAAGWLFRRAS